MYERAGARVLEIGFGGLGVFPGAGDHRQKAKGCWRYGVQRVIEGYAGHGSYMRWLLDTVLLRSDVLTEGTVSEGAINRFSTEINGWPPHARLKQNGNTGLTLAVLYWYTNGSNEVVPQRFPLFNVNLSLSLSSNL